MLEDHYLMQALKSNNRSFPCIANTSTIPLADLLTGIKDTWYKEDKYLISLRMKCIVHCPLLDIIQERELVESCAQLMSFGNFEKRCEALLRWPTRLPHLCLLTSTFLNNINKTSPILESIYKYVVEYACLRILCANPDWI